jgi:hypothetical protein
MERLTPELWLHSAIDGDTAAVETRELNFNLARRSAIVIVRIVSQLFIHVDVLSGNEIGAVAIQEVDVDPDNVDTEFAGALSPDAVVLDSSRVFRHYINTDRDTATGGGSQGANSLVIKDWTHAPDNERPISITNIRHHLRTTGSVSNVYHGEINIDYFIAELSLRELGILNASRR